MDRSTLRGLIRVMVGDENPVRWQNATLDAFMDMAIKRLSSTLRSSSSGSTVALTDGVGALPVDFLALERVTFDGNPLFKISRRELAQYTTPATTDVPVYFWVANGEIHTHPPVTGNIDIEYVSLSDVYALDASTTDPTLGHMAEDYIMHYTCWKLYLSIPDTDTATVHGQMCTDLEARLLNNILRDDADHDPHIGDNYESLVGEATWLF